MSNRKVKVTMVVTLPNKRQVRLGAYARAIRTAKASPNVTFSDWSEWGTTGKEIYRAFMRGVHDRINRHIPGFGKGRKWDTDWQAATRRAAHDINTPRLRVYVTSVPAWMRKDPRLAHRWASHDD